MRKDIATLKEITAPILDDIKIFNELIKKIETLDDFELWGDFNNSEVPNLFTREDKNGQKAGHTVLSDIEHIPTTSDLLGKPATFGDSGSDIQKKISHTEQKIIDTKEKIVEANKEIRKNISFQFLCR